MLDNMHLRIVAICIDDLCFYKRPPKDFIILGQKHAANLGTIDIYSKEKAPQISSRTRQGLWHVFGIGTSMHFLDDTKSIHIQP
jgi:hypothetical protein